MSKMPHVSGKDMGRILTRLGFRFKSQKGSHMKFIREQAYGKEVIIVPNHKTIRPGTLANILGKLALSVEKFKALI